MYIKDEIIKLSEDQLRQKIIIPLLELLGCIVRDNCGPRENGKDIIYIDRAHFLKENTYGAVILKIGKINKGRISDTILRQLNEATTPFPSPDNPLIKIRVHEILVITSGKITTDACEYIYNQSSRSFLNIHWIDGTRLEFLINQVIIDHNNKLHNNDYHFHIDTFISISAKKSEQTKVSTNSVNRTEGKRVE